MYVMHYIVWIYWAHYRFDPTLKVLNILVSREQHFQWASECFTALVVGSRVISVILDSCWKPLSLGLLWSSFYIHKHLCDSLLLTVHFEMTVYYYYAALLPRRGRILRRTLSVRLFVRPSHYRCHWLRLFGPASVTSRHLANYNDTHVLFGTHWGPHIVRPSRPYRFLLLLYYCCSDSQAGNCERTTYCVFCSEFDRNDLASHLDMTHSQISGLRELLSGSPQINIDPNVMLEVCITEADYYPVLLLR